MTTSLLRLWSANPEREAPLNALNFTFSDLIAGTVVDFDTLSDAYTVQTAKGDQYRVQLKSNTYAQVVRNLESPYIDCTGAMRDMLTRGCYVFTYGIFYPESAGHVFEAQFLVFVGGREGEYLFEKQDWWTTQIHALGAFYLKAQFRGLPIDYRDYRTTITLTGEKAADNYRQETDTISRLVYGFATAYMLSGEEHYLEAAEKGTQYLRDHMRFHDIDDQIVYWYHGIDVHGDREDKVFASEFGDDLYAIPAYEQIYALAGPVQTYRINGDPQILHDAELTVDLFDRFFLDREYGGYYSHLDPLRLDPRCDSLGANCGKKNWNSIGDHAPAYLINLFLATGSPRYARMLEYTFDTIVERFPDYASSPFVQEKFHRDWSPDREHMWQQNRAVVGHNMKIAWNLLRMYGHSPKPQYEELARKIADHMPAIGSDRQRGGWYDVMERVIVDGQKHHRFSFHDRKAWWQQEQAILAYLIMHGVLGDETYLNESRFASSFYNAFFLDHDDGAVYFNVLASGVPFLTGTERFKGSHSMSGYHAFELCYLAQVYTNLLITRRPIELHFYPLPEGFADRILRVAPDILPKGRTRLGAVWIDDQPSQDFHPERFEVRLPRSEHRVRVRVRIDPCN